MNAASRYWGMPELPNADDYLLGALRTEGVGHVFLVPGGLIDPFLPAFGRAAEVVPVVACQEGGAAYMADGYARATHRFGVCLTLGGPGFLNAVTGLAAAQSDESAVLVVSGEVPSDWEGRGGFQDASAFGLNDVQVAEPIAKRSLSVGSAAVFPHHLRAALVELRDLRRGPVHLGIPLDVQRAPIAGAYRPLDTAATSSRVLQAGALEHLAAILERTHARTIVLLAGHGIEADEGCDELRRLAERYELPVATTLRAKGALDETHPLALGVFGYAGTRHAIEGLTDPEVDLVIAIGTGLNQRDTLFWDAALEASRRLVQVDLVASFAGRDLVPLEFVRAGAGAFAAALLDAPPRLDGLLRDGVTTRREWLAKLRAGGSRLYDPQHLASDATPIHPARVVAELQEAAPSDTTVVVDSGAHRAFAGHYWTARAPYRYVSATNIGPMGWAIGAGIGVKAARPEQPVVVITGDGCMRMSGMEIATAARYGFAVVYVVINNAALGNVYLRMRAEGPVPAELTELPAHDWVGFARALGADGVRVDDPARLSDALGRAFAAQGPFVIDVRCDREAATPVAPWAHAAAAWHGD